MVLQKIDYYSGKTILVTGAAGFIGSSIVQALSGIDCHLICLHSGSREFELTPDSQAEITIRKGDIRSPSVWNELLEGVDIVFYFAAQTSSRFANENPIEDMEINLIPVVRFIETCLERDVRPDIIFSGTVTQTGLTTNCPVDERRCDTPITIYDISKLSGEKYLQYYGLEMGGRSVTIRLANVYGPGAQSGRSDRGILNMMVINALSGKPLTVYGEGNFIRDYVYIGDVVDAFLTAGAAMDVVNGKYYVLGSGKGVSIKEMVETVRDLVAKTEGTYVKIHHVSFPSDLSSIERRHFIADTHRFRMDSGWEPKFSLQEGIRRTIQYFKGR